MNEIPMEDGGLPSKLESIMTWSPGSVGSLLRPECSGMNSSLISCETSPEGSKKPTM